MAAETIQFSSFTVRSPDVAEQLSQTSSNIINIDEGAAPTRSSKGMMTTQAPTLVSTTATGGYNDELNEIMTAVMLALVELAKNSGEVDKVQTEAGNSAVKITKQLAEQAKQAALKMQRKIREERHRSGIMKIVSCVVGAVIFVIGALTADPALMMMGIFTTTMSATGGQQALDKHLSSNLGLKILEEVGIAVGFAIAFGGLGYAASSVATAGAGAAATAAADASTEAAADVSSSVATEATEESTQSTAEQSSQNAKTPTGPVGRAAGSLLMGTTMAGSLWSNIVLAIEEGWNKVDHKKQISKERMELSSAIAGIALTLAAGFGGGLLQSGTQFNGISSAFAKGMGEGVYSATRISLELGMMALYIYQGTLNIEQGQTQLAMAGISKLQGNNQANQSLVSNVLTRIEQQINQNQAAQQQINSTYTDINSRWGAYVDQYATAARLIG